MKLIINIAPAEFSNHFVSVAMPYTPLYCQEHDVKNGLVLEAVILNIKDTIFQDSIIFLDPIGRKFNGFDKWEKDHKTLLKIRAPQLMVYSDGSAIIK